MPIQDCFLVWFLVLQFKSWNYFTINYFACVLVLTKFGTTLILIVLIMSVMIFCFFATNVFNMVEMTVRFRWSATCDVSSRGCNLIKKSCLRSRGGLWEAGLSPMTHFGLKLSLKNTNWRRNYSTLCCTLNKYSQILQFRNVLECIWMDVTQVLWLCYSSKRNTFSHVLNDINDFTITGFHHCYIILL